MKVLSLLVWVTQLGFSILFPLCFFLLLAVWLQNRYGFGLWIMVLCAAIGILVTISTVRTCIRSLRKAAEEASDHKENPPAFNDHH